eukprot:TRINITY_DN64624_c1_g1_i1.p1 TRINITY_DN64624_c1_g1~~TRINITY_DN64624_c1_g1_i1.p1  ORF type:complete len:261 (+),score=42.73 TRINITY_DN64624_c1_g1_i1:116-784(+)
MTYFEGTEGLIESYEFDYDKILDFQWSVAQNNYYASLVTCVPILCSPCFFGCGRDNMKDAIEAQHVCITHDGIRYVVDRHRTGCRFDFQEQGKVTKTVPFDKLTDCDIEEPAGAEGPICCMVNRVLYQVNVDTASSGGPVGPDGRIGHELTLIGLKDPHGFKSKVWAMKRNAPAAMGGASPAPSQMTMDGKGSELVPLLARQNQLLEENNSLLKQIVENTSK